MDVLPNYEELTELTELPQKSAYILADLQRRGASGRPRPLGLGPLTQAPLGSDATFCRFPKGEKKVQMTAFWVPCSSGRWPP